MLFKPEKRLRKQLVFFTLSFLFLVLLLEVRGALERSDSSSACLECHKEDFAEDLLKSVIHAPCQEKRCISCHCLKSAAMVADAPAIKSSGEVVPDSGSAAVAPEMSVIDVHLHSDASHSFIFPEDKVDGVLLVELWDGKERLKVEKIALLPLAQLPMLVDDKQPPKISDIKIVKVERGLSSTAVISWKTDEPATSEIKYGIDELNRHSFPHGCLVRNHRLTLPSLKTNHQYRFALVASDFFGNQMVSEIQALSTAKEIEEKLEGDVGLSSGEGAIVKKELFNADGHYLVIFELSQSLSLSIGGAGVPEPAVRLPSTFATPIPVKGESLAVTSADEDDEHRYLLSEIETTIGNCFSCHKNIRKEMSHPVDVYPAPGMQVPKEYPLLSNGKMSCMSCHVRHAGDNLYRLVRAQGKQFCEGCHATY